MYSGEAREGSWLRAFRHASFFLKTTAVVVTIAFLGLYLQPLALAAQLPERKAQAPREESNEAKLARKLERLEARLEKHQARLERRAARRAQAQVQAEEADLRAEQDQLKTDRAELDALDKQAMEDFRRIEQHLKDKRLPQVILDRHYEAVKQYQQEMATLKANLDDMDRAKDDEERKTRAKKAKEHLRAKRQKRAQTPIDPASLPTRLLHPNKDNKPRLRKEEFTSAGLFDNPSIKLAALGDFRFDKLPGASDPAYLAAAADVPISEAIKAKAQDLEHDPVKIYQFVRNNIEWVPSWGSIQGGELTLRSLKGNAMDTASLLIALLRASGIPSRYVHGTIEVSAERFMNWAGGFTHASSAADFASTGGIPIVSLVNGGKIVAYRLEHAWVEAAIDFYPSYGEINKSADTWVQLDPSFKQHDITEGIDVTAAIPFSADEYLTQVRTDNPVQYYQQQIQTYIDGSLPDKTLGQVMGFRSIRPETGTVLPSGLPWKTIVAANRYGTLPAALRTSVQFDIAGETITFPTVEVAGRRLTLSYAPASAADASLIETYGGDVFAVPPYLLYLKPVLKRDGEPVYTGSGVQMAQEQILGLAYQRAASYASSTVSSFPARLIVGGYYAIGLDLQGASAAILGHGNRALIEILSTQTTDTAQVDDVLGEHLHALVMTYFLMNDKFYRGAAKLYRMAQQRALSAGVIGIAPTTISSVFGVPRSASPNRLKADIGLELLQVVSSEGNAAKRQAFQEMAGLVGSHTEHAVFEAIHEFESISAVKAIQVSAAQGIPIYKIDQSNVDQLLPLLQLATEDKREIQDGIAVGLIAIVPQREIVLNDWRGAGFILKDPQTSSGAYRISGGLSGGSTTSNKELIKKLFGDSTGWLKSIQEPITRSYIVALARVEAAEPPMCEAPYEETVMEATSIAESGAKVAEEAENILRKKKGSS